MRETELDGGFPARGGRDGDDGAGAGGDGGADGGAGDAGAREIEADATMVVSRDIKVREGFVSIAERDERGSIWRSVVSGLRV